MLKRITTVEPPVVRNLMELYRESMAQLERRFESPQAMEQAYGEFLNEFVTHPNQMVLVEEESGVWVSGLRCIETAPRRWYLEALETAPQARGRGCARRLLGHVQQLLGQKGDVELFSLIHPSNQRSQATHIACGFAATQRPPINGWGEEEAGMMVYVWLAQERLPCI